MLPKVIYIMGAPGSGKGTQAKLLSEALGYVQFSTGDAFRSVSHEDTELGRRVKETIDNGYLAPPEMAAEIVKAAVKKHLDQGKGLIFDGTPRTVKEAQMVDEFFAEQKYGVPLVIYLSVDREEMTRRNSKRRFCLGIKGDFPVANEADQERCSSLGGTVGVRPDDDPGKFVTRWDQFVTLTQPVIEEYRVKGMVHEINGMPAVEEVRQQIMKVIEETKRGN